MAGTGVGKFSSTAGSNTGNMTVNFAENMAPSNVNNAARELMGHMRDMYEQLGDGYFEFGDGDGVYTIARVDADTLTIATAADLSTTYFAGRKIRVTDGGANVVEGTIASTSHGSSLQTVNLTGISLASGTPTKVEIGIDTAAFGGKLILDDDGDTFIEAPTDDTIDIHIAGAKDFVFTANTFTAESGSTIAAQALTATTVNASGIVTGSGFTAGSAVLAEAELELLDGLTAGTAIASKVVTTDANIDTSGQRNLTISGELDAATGDFSGAVDVAGAITSSAGATISTTGTGNTLILQSTDASSTAGPRLRLKRDSSSPADSDNLGRIIFSGENDASEEIDYAFITVFAEAVADGSESAQLSITQRLAGGEVDRLSFGSSVTVFNDNSVDLDFRVESNNVQFMLFVDGGTDQVMINESSSPADGGSLTINHGNNDGNSIEFKNSDVAHGMTDFFEADTYLSIRKTVANNGGANIRGVTEDEQALSLQGYSTNPNTTKSTVGEGIVAVSANIRNGTSVADPGADANLFVVNAGGNAKFIVDTEGQLHSDGGALSAYDTFEDAQLVRAFDLSHGNGVMNSKFDKFISYNHEKLAEMKLVGREPDGTPNHFINVTGMQRLHNGAIWQQYEKTEKLANAMYELAKAAVGEEKANEILEQNEIKLLN